MTAAAMADDYGELDYETAWARLLAGPLRFADDLLTDAATPVDSQWACNAASLPMSVPEAHQVTREHASHPATVCAVKARALEVLTEAGCRIPDSGRGHGVRVVWPRHRHR